jgi:flagellar biosynthesis protein FlhA
MYREVLMGILVILLMVGFGACFFGGTVEQCLEFQLPEKYLGFYTGLIIAELLIRQIPALLTALAIGLITLKPAYAKPESLGRSFFSEIQSKPEALMFAGSLFLLIAASSGVSGLPWWAFHLFAVLAFGVAFSVYLARDVQQQLGRLDTVKQKMSELINPNRMYEKLGVDVLRLEVGTDLLKIADPEQDGQLLGKIAALRSRMTDELGFILPNIRIMDSLTIAPTEYLISIRNNPVATGSVYPDRYMLLANYFESMGLPPPQNVVMGRDPTYGADCYWLEPQDIPQELQPRTVDATDAIIAHLNEVVVKYVDEVMTKMDVLKLMELVRQQDQSLIQELVPAIITPNDLRKIFVNLIREKVSIKDILFVFERLSDYARFSREPDVLSERLRAALGRQICISHSDQAKVMYAVTLSNEWEKLLDDSCQRTELGTMFLLNPIQVQELIETTAETLRNAQQSYDRVPVILCSPRIRLPLYQLLDRHIPMVAVLSYSELVPEISVQAIGTIHEDSTFD